MTTAITLAVAALLIITTSAGAAWAIGRTGAVKDTHAWKKGYATGNRDGLVVGERQRDALQAELDRTCAALEELGALYDRAVARRFIPEITRAVYDHERNGL